MTLFTLTIFLIGIWSLAFYASRMLYADIERMLSEHQYSTATVLAEEVNHELEHRFNALKKSADIISPAMLDNAPSVQTLLEHSYFLMELFSGGLVVYNADSLVIADSSLSAGRRGIYFKRLEHVADALKLGKASISKPYIVNSQKNPEFSMVVPIRNSDGKVIAALAGLIDLNKPSFLDHVTNNHYGKTGGYLLVAPQHRLIVTATDQKRIMEASPALGTYPLIDRFMQGYEGSGIGLNPRGVEVVASAKSVALAGWYVNVSLPTAEAFAPIHDMQQRLLLAALLVTIFAGGLTWWMLQRQLSPIFHSMKLLASFTNEKHLPRRTLPIHRHDEIGGLIGGFNHLLETLWEREATLTETEKRYRTLVGQTTEAIIVHRNEKVLYVNPAAIQLFGAGSEQDLAGIPFLELVSPDFHHIVLARIKTDSLDLMPTSQAIGKFIKLDGTVFDAEIQGVAILFDHDRAIQTTLRDVTEHNQTDFALRKANRYSTILNAVNRRLLHAKDENELFQHICQIIIQHCEYQFAWVGRLIHDEEKSIRPVAHYGFEQGFLTSLNATWADNEFGQCIAGRAVQSGQLQIAHNIMKDECNSPWRIEALKRGYASCLSLPLVHDGNVFGVLSIYANQVEVFTREEAKFLEGMASDLIFGVISLRTRYERDIALARLRSTSEALERTSTQVKEERQQLAQRVEERTAQLLYANKAKDAFLATMSHEIRTPLGGLLGMMEVLNLSQLNDQQREILKTAQGSGANLLRIVDDILDWSKIEAGKLLLAPHISTLHQMLDEVSNNYKQLANEKGVELRVKIDEKISAAHFFDPLRLSQILNNFTSNAVKFTSQGFIEIIVESLSQKDNKETVRICVNDSGIGIGKEQLQRLFQLYEQGSADTARMYGGTGLGLSISRSLAQLLGGTINVKSTLGLGSIFSITLSLPIAKLVERSSLSSGHARLRKGENEPSVSPFAFNGQCVSILVVDDHPVNRTLLKKQLDLLGVNVETAADGAVALSLWQSNQYAAVITDCHMPIMDGYELARSIRAAEQHHKQQRVPIIAWTANVLFKDEAIIYESGMDDKLGEF